jgi:RNA polymerase sigma-70 factor (ECF subfamily)
MVNDSAAIVGTGQHGPSDVQVDLGCLRQGIITLDQKITELFETQRDAVYRYTMTIVRSPAIAEEVTQEAFIRLYSYLRKGGAVGHYRAWIFRTAHNLAVNESTRKYLTSSVVDWDELCRQRQDLGPNPEQNTLQEESFVHLRAAMGRLATQQRQCILLRAEGFRYAEIAKILGVSKSTVAESLRRAMHKLKVYSDV